ncbi:hypothetical protein TOPH_08479 [Tolypocladium ophioglossoides CBS 100239]|uniref:Uncharacterized protein n=1 Tax=Tolypocladium ophioglossoides (strain CBS 100239) TaxID=1163406 RepID=A0A0L0MYM5_TOLOC|nr:hypothetical protein TOPH_08479 [Tolypocladium ophioglossoides CBS 100239]
MDQDEKPHFDITPFLSNSENADDNAADYGQVQRSYRGKSWVKAHRLALLFHCTMLLLYALFSVAVWSGPCRYPRAQLYTPAQNFVQTRIQVINDGPRAIDESPYVGSKPKEAIGAAWDHLLRCTIHCSLCKATVSTLLTTAIVHNFRFSEEEMRKMNKTSIGFARGGGYHGMMAVFHELHCLVRPGHQAYLNIKLIRRAIHKDEYYKEKGHNEHCIDILRMAAMCRADTSIYPYFWSDSNRYPNPKWERRHECVDWEKLEEFLEARRVDIFVSNMLVHPKYVAGPSFPGGQAHIEERNGPQIYPLDPE